MWMNVEKLLAKIWDSIIQDIVEQGGDIATGYFPGCFARVALKHRVKPDTVRKLG